MIDYDEYVKQRKVIRESCDRSKKYLKGHKVQSLNLCSKCGRTLSKLILPNFEMKAVYNYTRYSTDFMYYNLCTSARACYAYYKKQKEENK